MKYAARGQRLFTPVSCFASPEDAMAVFRATWVVIVAVCGGAATAGEERTPAAWWRAAGEDLVKAWAQQEEASTVTLLLLADGVCIYICVIHLRS